MLTHSLRQICGPPEHLKRDLRIESHWSIMSRVAFFGVDAVVEFGTEYCQTMLHYTMESATMAFFKGEAMKRGLAVLDSVTPCGMLYHRQHASPGHPTPQNIFISMSISTSIHFGATLLPAPCQDISLSTSISMSIAEKYCFPFHLYRIHSWGMLLRDGARGAAQFSKACGKHEDCFAWWRWGLMLGFLSAITRFDGPYEQIEPPYMNHMPPDIKTCFPCVPMIDHNTQIRFPV